MLRYFLRRIIALIPTLLILSFVVFSLLYLAGGSPAASILGLEATPQEVAELNEKLGYNRPFPEQYLQWLGNAIKGNLGDSLFLKKPVAEALGKNLQVSLELASLSLLISVIIAIPLSVRAVEKPGGIADGIVNIFSPAFIAIPSFVLSLLLVLVFAVGLNWLPSSGYIPIDRGLGKHFKSLILPSFSLALGQAAYIAKMSRRSLIEIRSRLFMKSLKARGIPRKRILYIHLLKNAFVPIITIIGGQFAFVLAGAVVVETIFQIPGLGLLMMNAIKRRDIPVVQGVILSAGIIYLLVSLLIDFIYGLLDPRIRLDEEAAA